MGVELTAAQKKKLQPTRAGGTAVAPTERALKQLAKAARAREAKQRMVALRRGAEAGELRELATAALALLEQPTAAAIAAADLDALAAAERMLPGRDVSLTEAVAFTRGVADAVEVKRRSLAYALTSTNWTWAVTLVAATDDPERWIGSWLPLRHAVCAASDDDYAAARARARIGWDERGVEQNARFAYAFPDEPWAEGLLGDPAAIRAVSSNLVGTPSQVVQLGFLLSACRDAAIARAFASLPHGAFAVSQSALELALALPSADAVALFVEVLPALLVKPRYQPLLKTPPRDVLEALLLVGTLAAIEVAAGYIGHRVLGAMAAAFFQDHPEHRAALRGAGAAAEELADRLEAVEARHEGAPAARADAVPAVLRERAWRPPKKRPRPRVVKGVSLLEPLEEHVDLPPGYAVDALPPLPAEQVEAWRKDLAKSRGPVDVVHDYRARTAFEVPREEGLAAWNAGRGYLGGDPLRFVAVHGADALPGFVKGRRLANLDYEGADAWADALARVVSPRAAPIWARIASSRKRWRPFAVAWLRAQWDLAASGLVPDAVGKTTSARVDAEAALLDLARTGHDVRAAAARYAPEVREAIEVLLARDPRLVEANPPKLPPFLSLDALPPIELRAGGRLPEDARDAFIELLSVAPPEHPSFPELAEAFVADSTDAFVGALLEVWAAADGPGRHDWMLRASVALPTEATTRRLSELARRWARSKQAPAIRACDALAAIGSDLALMHLGHIAATTRFSKLRGEVAARLDEVAGARGLSRDQLEDRTVPDLDLDADGALRLEVGGQVLRASFDEALTLVLTDADGARLRSFPRGKKTDAAHAEAKARHDALKKDAAAVSGRLLARLERAMVDQRRWAFADAASAIFTHPLARHVARGLVWQSAQGAFRVTDEGGLADVSDEEVVLSPEEPVWIAHPLRLTDAWDGVFADYELLQPFVQLGRPTHAPTAAERRATSVTRAERRVVAATKLLGVLESRGWRRDSAGDVRAWHRDLSGGLELRMGIEPGVEIAYLRDAPPQKLGPVEVLRGGEPATVAELGDVAFSELVLDLDALG